MNQIFVNQKGKVVLLIVLIIAIIVIVLVIKSRKATAPSEEIKKETITNLASPNVKLNKNSNLSNTNASGAKTGELLINAPQNLDAAQVEVKKMQQELKNLQKDISAGKNLDLSDLEAGDEITNKLNGL